MEANLIEIETSDKITLDGFIFGPKKAKTIYIFLHGLGGDLFSRIDLAQELVSKEVAVMMFNNRGYGIYNRFKKVNKNNVKGYSSFLAGSASEVFKESIYDISGAISEAGRQGYKEIILIGHSTGCNKISYYLSRNYKDNVLAGILLAPMSDYAAIKKSVAPVFLAKAELKAKRLVLEGKSDEFLAKKYWPNLISAQRFLSLYTKESLEEIFCYASYEKKSTVLRKIKKPVLTILAGEDEYANKDVSVYVPWFTKEIKAMHSKVMVIPEANHGFKNKQKILKKEILKFVKSLKK